MEFLPVYRAVCDVCGQKIEVTNPKRFVHCLICQKNICIKCDTYGCCDLHFQELPIETQMILVKTGKKVERKSYHWKVIGLPVLLFFIMLLFTRWEFFYFILPAIFILLLFEWFNWNAIYISQYKRYQKLNRI